VLQAAAIGESGQVLVLDMGEPVKIVDLAKPMLAGKTEQEIPIVFTGLRPGRSCTRSCWRMRCDDAHAHSASAARQALRGVGPHHGLAAGRPAGFSAANGVADDTVRQTLSRLVSEFRMADAPARG
jgi:hypothetical protein